MAEPSTPSSSAQVEIISPKNAITTTTEASSVAASIVTPGQPKEQLQVEESTPAEDEIVYPMGYKLWLNIGAFMIVNFVRSVDITIVAVAVCCNHIDQCE